MNGCNFERLRFRVLGTLYCRATSFFIRRAKPNRNGIASNQGCVCDTVCHFSLLSFFVLLFIIRLLLLLLLLSHVTSIILDWSTWLSDFIAVLRCVLFRVKNSTYARILPQPSVEHMHFLGASTTIAVVQRFLEQFFDDLAHTAYGQLRSAVGCAVLFARALCTKLHAEDLRASMGSTTISLSLDALHDVVGALAAEGIPLSMASPVRDFGEDAVFGVHRPMTTQNKRVAKARGEVILLQFLKHNALNRRHCISIFLDNQHRSHSGLGFPRLSCVRPFSSTLQDSLVRTVRSAFAQCPVSTICIVPGGHKGTERAAIHEDVAFWTSVWGSAGAC